MDEKYMKRLNKIEIPPEFQVYTGPPLSQTTLDTEKQTQTINADDSTAEKAKLQSEIDTLNKKLEAALLAVQHNDKQNTEITDLKKKHTEHLDQTIKEKDNEINAIKEKLNKTKLELDEALEKIVEYETAPTTTKFPDKLWIATIDRIKTVQDKTRLLCTASLTDSGTTEAILIQIPNTEITKLQKSTEVIADGD